MQRKKTLKKIRADQRGFTLTELLASLLIIVLIAAVTASGLPLVLDAYDRVVARSDAGVMLSTVMTGLRNELSTASELQLSSDGKSVEYISASTGEATRLYLEDDRIFVAKIDRNSAAKVLESHLLVPESTGRAGLKASFDKLEMNGGIICVCGLKISGRDGTEHCFREQYFIRNLAEA